MTSSTLSSIIPGMDTNIMREAGMTQSKKALEEQVRRVNEAQERHAKTMQAEKVRENRLRRMADRQGLKLIKSRVRDPYAKDFGLYWIDVAWVMDGAIKRYDVIPDQANWRGPFDDLDEVERYLTGEGRE
jgi:hypothetical protein